LRPDFDNGRIAQAARDLDLIDEPPNDHPACMKI